jgi:two-component system LytT family response regulator
LIVRSTDRITIVAAEDIDWIASANNYVLLHVGTATHILREKIGLLEARLEPGRFVRISRSALVNVRCIHEIVQEGSGHVLVMRNGARQPITRGIRDVLTQIEVA